MPNMYASTVHTIYYPRLQTSQVAAETLTAKYYWMFHAQGCTCVSATHMPTCCRNSSTHKHLRNCSLASHAHAACCLPTADSEMQTSSYYTRSPSDHMCLQHTGHVSNPTPCALINHTPETQAGTRPMSAGYVQTQNRARS